MPTVSTWRTVLDSMLELWHRSQVIPPRWLSCTVLCRMVRSAPLTRIPSPPATVKPSTTTWSAVMWMLRTAAPSERSVIGALAAPGRVRVRSVPDRPAPVKQSVVPGAATSKAADASSAWLTVRVQAGGGPWLGPAAEFGPDGALGLGQGLGFSGELGP